MMLFTFKLGWGVKYSKLDWHENIYKAAAATEKNKKTCGAVKIIYTKTRICYGNVSKLLPGKFKISLANIFPNNFRIMCVWISQMMMVYLNF